MVYKKDLNKICRVCSSRRNSRASIGISPPNKKYLDNLVIKRMYLEEQKSQKDISESFGVDRVVIRRILKELGIIHLRDVKSFRRLRIREALTGENNHSWKGGIEKENKKIRESPEYLDWRKSVFERDRYTCVFCGKRGGKLEVDHIKPFALFPSLRLDINNGRTLCSPCHKTTNTYRKSILQLKKLFTNG